MTTTDQNAEKLMEEFKASKNPEAKVQDTLATESFDKLQVAKIEKESAELRAFNSLEQDEQELAKKIASTMDVADSNAIMTYGSTAQSKVNQFSDRLLSQTKASDFEGVGDSLNELMTTLNDTNPTQFGKKSNGFFSRLLAPAKRKMTEVQQSQQNVAARIDAIADDLNMRKELLMQDTAMLEDLYTLNLEHFHDLNLYIAAGEIKMKEMEQEVIPAALDKAEKSMDQMDAQEVKDLNEALTRLDRRVHDLRLARQITLQQAPQIRLIQATNQTLTEKIQSSIMNTIPVWRNQFALALTISRQEDTAEATRAVGDTTNDILNNNAKLLNQSSVSSAREAERGMVEVETLQNVQNELISTIEEVMKVQIEGREKRKAAEIELANMENDMKGKLLELSQEKGAYVSGNSGLGRKRKNVN